jgi:chromosome segregation ATPase
MPDSVIDDVNEGVIKELQARITKLEEANEFIKAENTKISSRSAELQRGYEHYKKEYEKLKMREGNSAAAIERYERIIDHFLDNV